MNPVASTAWAIAVPVITFTTCWGPVPAFNAQLDLRGYTLTQALDGKMMTAAADVSSPSGIVFKSPPTFLPAVGARSLTADERAQTVSALQTSEERQTPLFGSTLRR